jgi:hypothetical protein
MKTFRFWLIGIFFSALLLVGCGGGGGGGGSPATPAPTTVSGTVQTPNGQVALNTSQRLKRFASNLILREASADLIGLSPVPDGTKVQLVRIDPVTGLTQAEIASTTTSGGRFTFNLTQLGIGFSNTLIVQLAEETGIKLRAFVVDGIANLEPVSEAVVELILEEIARDPARNLDRFSVAEIKSVAGIADFLTAQDSLSAGLNTGLTVAAVKQHLIGAGEFSNNLAVAVAGGESSSVTIDPLNLFPLSLGNSWEYISTMNTGFVESQTMKVTGTKEVKGVQTSVIARFGQFDLNNPISEDFFHKDSSGVNYYGDADLSVARFNEQIVPYLRLKLPAKLGEVVTEIPRRSLDFGSDLDGDGKNERVESVSATHTAIGYESITTPASACRCLKVVEDVNIEIKLSSNGVRVNTKVVTTWWLAPGIGILKMIIDVDASASNGFRSAASETKELQRAKIDDVVYPGAAKINVVALTHNDVVYDASRNRFYASVPSGAGASGNSIAIVDPNSGVVTQSIPIGSEPRALGLSKDAGYLYVGLDGSGQITRLNLSTLVADQNFSVGTNTSGTQLYARRIEAMTGNPNLLIVGWGQQTDSGISGIRIFDGGVKRPNEIPTAGFEVSFASAFAVAPGETSLYAHSSGNTFPFEGTRQFNIDQDGLTLTTVAPILPTQSVQHLILDNNRIYTDSGVVFDLNTLGAAGTYLNTRLCIPESAKNRTYCIGNNFPSKVMAFDQANFQPLESLEIGDSSNFGFSTGPISKLIRWGSNGLAVSEQSQFSGGQGSGKLHIIRSTKLVP